MSVVAIFALVITAIVVASYLIGNFNFASAYARCRGVDIYHQGSGNPGTMNMLRTFGVKVAIATLLVDALKGLIPAIAAYYIMQCVPSFGFGIDANAPAILGYYVSGVGKSAMMIAGFSAFIGHCFPVFSKFRGGKGVATAFGVFLATDPLIAFGLFLVGLGQLFIGKYGFVSSFLCIIPSSFVEMSLALVYGDALVAVIAPILISVVMVALHHENIVRVAKGIENDSNLMRRLRAHKAEKAAAQNAEVPNFDAQTAEVQTAEVQNAAVQNAEVPNFDAQTADSKNDNGENRD